MYNQTQIFLRPCEAYAAKYVTGFAKHKTMITFKSNTIIRCIKLATIISLYTFMINCFCPIQNNFYEFCSYDDYFVLVIIFIALKNEKLKKKDFFSL